MTESETTICAEKDCNDTASIKPVMTFSYESDPETPAGEISLPYLCRENADAVPKHFHVCDSCWTWLCEEFKTRGWSKPDRETLSLRFEPLQ